MQAVTDTVEFWQQVKDIILNLALNILTANLYFVLCHLFHKIFQQTLGIYYEQTLCYRITLYHCNRNYNESDVRLNFCPTFESCKEDT